MDFKAGEDAGFSGKGAVSNLSSFSLLDKGSFSEEEEIGDCWASDDWGIGLRGG